MCAAFRNRAVLTHIDAVGFKAVVQPVGNHEDCLCLRYLPYDAHYELLALRVDVAGGLIKNHDLGVDQEGSGKADALGLAAGNICTFLFKLHGKAAPLLYERNKVDRVKSLIEFLICRSRFSHSQVISH